MRVSKPPHSFRERVRDLLTDRSVGTLTGNRIHLLVPFEEQIRNAVLSGLLGLIDLAIKLL